MFVQTLYAYHHQEPYTWSTDVKNPKVFSTNKQISRIVKLAVGQKFRDIAYIIDHSNRLTFGFDNTLAVVKSKCECC